MTKPTLFGTSTVVAAGILALCLVALVVVRPVEAAFPGNDGKIVFWSDRSSGPGLYTTTTSSAAATKIPGTAGGDAQATWSPDGTRIVFQSTSRSSKEISVMNADGSGRRQLTSTDTLAEQEPTWSPDGTQIAFVAGTSDTDTTTDLEIWVMDADGSDLVQLTNTLQGVRDTQPAWSPDGNRFAFLSEGRVGDSNSNIYVMDANPLTNDASNLTDDDGTMTPVYQYNDEDPSWSPDGTQISYSTKADVWKMNAADGSGKVNLTTGNGGGSQPAWSPDGDSIVYVRGGDIYVMDNNGDNKTPVDTTLRKDEKPDWQPIPQCTESVSAANDPLTGTAGKDVLCGDALNNTINGAGGNDIILAQGGNDKLTGALGNDTLDGGPGTDTVLYPGSTAVRANLTTEFATGVGSDVLLGIENLRGSGASDRLIGSAATNALVGGAGADTLSGLNGNDTLTSRDGVSGNDTVNGGPGTDRCVTDASEALVASCP